MAVRGHFTAPGGPLRSSGEDLFRRALVQRDRGYLETATKLLQGALDAFMVAGAPDARAQVLLELAEVRRLTGDVVGWRDALLDAFVSAGAAGQAAICELVTELLYPTEPVALPAAA